MTTQSQIESKRRFKIKKRRRRLTEHGPVQVTVYFISDGTGHIKIGRTKLDATTRLRHMQVFNATELRLEAIEMGGPTLELDMQLKFASARVRGEWFRFTPDIAEHIDDLRALTIPSESFSLGITLPAGLSAHHLARRSTTRTRTAHNHPKADSHDCIDGG